MKKRVVIIVAIIAALFLLILYGSFNPENHLFPKCPFFWATGLKCPGCGSQRAIHQLLHFNIAAAFRYNAIFVLFLPVLAFLLIAELLKDRYPKLFKASHNTCFSWGIVIVICAWWILRNIFGW